MMTNQYRIIRKEINLTPEELGRIQELMRKEHAEHYQIEDKLICSAISSKDMI